MAIHLELFGHYNLALGLLHDTCFFLHVYFYHTPMLLKFQELEAREG